MLTVGLLLGGVVGAVLLLYALDRLIKARAQIRRLRKMTDRLSAATARAEKQQEQRQAAERASQELTSYIPAIKRPPHTLPDPAGEDPARNFGEDPGPAP